MTLHFLHIGKTGGTAIKSALREAKLAHWREHNLHKGPDTPFGKIWLHPHAFRLRDLPPDDFVFFCVRDPVSRYVSAFYSRLRRGAPRYETDWTPAEREAFDAFPTPQALAAALASRDRDERERARAAMRSVRHLGSMQRALGSPAELRRRARQIAYIFRQETLSDDWPRALALLGLPTEVTLPSDSVRAHRQDASLDRALDDVAVKALQTWYARDYRLVSLCDRIRARNGWGVVALPPMHRMRARMPLWL